MPDSRHDDAPAPGSRAARRDPYWEHWFRHTRATALDDGERLRRRWCTALEEWWRSAAPDLGPEASGFLRRALDQAELLCRPGAGDPAPAGGSRRDRAMWCMPLALWEQAAAAMLERAGASRPTASHPRLPAARREYAGALADYATLLESVGAETLARVTARLDATRGESPAPTDLRGLFDLYVDEGETCYLEAVASETFAEIGGRLINGLAACLRLGGACTGRHGPGAAGEAGHAHARTRESGRGADALLDVAGLDPAQVLVELRGFGDKLAAALETLRGLGPIETGSCRRRAVHREGKLVLYRYESTRARRGAVPLLIVYALANRPCIMDLEAGRSIVGGLLEAGLDVYLIDWGYPDEADSRLDLDAYVNGLVGRCVEHVRRAHAKAAIDVLGVCQGGTFALCYAALNPDKVRNLVTMVTPVDFHAGPSLLAHWLRHVDADLLVDTLGNVPGALLNWAFVSLKPLKLTGRKYLDMLDQLDDEAKARTFLRMERWIHDNPDQAGQAFREFVRDLFQGNKLVRDQLEIGGRRVRLGNVTMPVLNVYARDDHIVPPESSLALEGHVGSPDYSVLAFDGGHIGIYVSARAQREVPPKIAEWLVSRQRA